MLPTSVLRQSISMEVPWPWLITTHLASLVVPQNKLWTSSHGCNHTTRSLAVWTLSGLYLSILSPLPQSTIRIAQIRSSSQWPLTMLYHLNGSASCVLKSKHFQTSTEMWSIDSWTKNDSVVTKCGQGFEQCRTSSWSSRSTSY